jgi:hypothetical protein
MARTREFLVCLLSRHVVCQSTRKLEPAAAMAEELLSTGAQN